MTAAALDRFLARSARLTGVRVQSLALQEDFVDLAARFAHLPGTVVLLSGGDLDCSRYHLLGALPWLTLSGRSQTTTLTIDDQTLQLQHDPLTVLRSILEHFRLQPAEASLPMAAGLMGYQIGRAHV